MDRPLVGVVYKYQNAWPGLVSGKSSMAFQALDTWENGNVLPCESGWSVNGHTVTVTGCDCETRKVRAGKYGLLCVHRLAVMYMHSPVYKQYVINQRLIDLVVEITSRGGSVDLLLAYNYDEPDQKTVIGYSVDGKVTRWAYSSGNRFKVDIDQVRHALYSTGIGVINVARGSAASFEYRWKLIRGRGLVVTDQLWMRREKSNLTERLEGYEKDFRAEIAENGNNLGVKFGGMPHRYGGRSGGGFGSGGEPPRGSYWSNLPPIEDKEK